MAEKLKIIPLGGLNEIGKNITVVEYGNDMIVIDCGLGFPEDDMYGVDLVVPDVTYLEKNADKLRGFFITHGHEDHIGGIPYVFRRVNAPIHATALTAGLIRLKLEEHNLAETTDLQVHKAGDTIKAGCFKVELIRVNHSIPDAVGFAIHTPVGIIVFTGDFKIDSTPVNGEIIDLARLGTLGQKGVLALLCDSTNVEREGYSPSESTVSHTFDELFKGCDQRIIVTTFASNVYRIQSVLNSAARYGRKVAVTGRSLENILKVSTELGYLHIPENTLVDINNINSLPKDKVVIITTGSQGENMSALYRIAFSGHRQVAIVPGDRVLISASAIPGNEKTVSTVIDELYRKGAEVVYDKLANLHVSGHACKEELKIIHALVKPKFFIPVHGEQRHLRRHAQLAREMGMDPSHILITETGRAVELTRNTAKLGEVVPSGKMLVDGLSVGDVGSVVLRDRKHLASDGMIVVVISLSSEDSSIISGPDIITRGFIYVKESEEMMDQLREVAEEAVEDCLDDGVTDWATIKSSVKSELSHYLFRNTKRNPMILPVIMEI